MKTSPSYRCPRSFEELGARVPRLVNGPWLVLALRDQARATVKGDFLPWNSEDLHRRAATYIEFVERRQ